MTKILIVDDSAVVRQLLTAILNSADDIEVVGTARDPIFAMRKIPTLAPDVITLDVEMPRMDGLEFLSELMKTCPLPVVMISAYTQQGCETTLKALELGAVDYVLKPEAGGGLAGIGLEIVSRVRVAAAARVRVSSGKRNVQSVTGRMKLPDASSAAPIHMPETDRIIAIGASTGGSQAITEIITALPRTLPGIFIVQHMPPLFTKSFADRLNSMSELDVREAVSGERIARGDVRISRGDYHLEIRRNGARYYAELNRGPRVNFVRPSVDVFFRSVARHAGKNAIGVILTGMGEDGARGLYEMREAGAFTIAQDEASSVIFGMPKKAIEIGAAERIVPLDDIPAMILEHC